MSATELTRPTTAGPVVTRFAPSPTGFLHLGGARTALFNWLFARHHGGQFKLRIEDTDRARSTQPAIDAILDGMRWLGLNWDGDEIYQFARAERHAEVAEELIARGAAYRCYLSTDELKARREAAQAQRKPFRLVSEWRDRGPDDAPPGASGVVRLKAPREGETTIEDAVQGKVTVQNAEVDDFVLLRSDGTPTYMLAVAVDDHDMGVTHCIRGDDHLNNAFRQRVLIDAMGWDRMVYAHVPLIHGHDGAKLSKRHGALGIETYRDELGILPEAMVNYLLRLGWGHGDDEFISRDDAVKWFDLAHVGRSPSRFDIKKLENLNGHYLREADDARLAGIVAPDIANTLDKPLSADDMALLTRAMPELKPRAKTLHEIADGALFLFRVRPLTMDDKAAALVAEAPTGLFDEIAVALSALDQWTTQTIEEALRELSERLELKLGKLAQPLRAAMTGTTVSPGIFDVLALLGRDETLARLADASQMRASHQD
ncbi:MAG: glutamate--tRNA ligase [Sphingomonadales bacterium]|nr:glutamate--tRNA ligase [Sphingomonadales bacterium]